MDKLTSVEASRMVSVLEEALDKLVLLSYVPEQQSQSAVLSEVEPGPYDILSHQWELEEQFNMLLNRCEPFALLPFIFLRCTPSTQNQYSLATWM
jgi:hypothetical protein